jgi:hypothetical protein
MSAYVEIGGSEVLTLQGALLVYRGRSRGFVTWHDVRSKALEGGPFLGEAQELTTDWVFVFLGSIGRPMYLANGREGSLLQLGFGESGD